MSSLRIQHTPGPTSGIDPHPNQPLESTPTRGLERPVTIASTAIAVPPNLLSRDLVKEYIGRVFQLSGRRLDAILEVIDNSQIDRRYSIFPVDYLVWYLSQFMVLEPGDLVNTGTPKGVSMGHDDVPYLKAGDVVELSIDGLGSQRSELSQA